MILFKKVNKLGLGIHSHLLEQEARLCRSFTESKLDFLFLKFQFTSFAILPMCLPAINTVSNVSIMYNIKDDFLFYT